MQKQTAFWVMSPEVGCHIKKKILCTVTRGLEVNGCKCGNLGQACDYGAARCHKRLWTLELGKEVQQNCPAGTKYKQRHEGGPVGSRKVSGSTSEQREGGGGTQSVRRGAATQAILHITTILTATPSAGEWDRPRISFWNTVFFFKKKHLSTLYNPGTEGSTGYTGTNRNDWSLCLNGRRISKQLKTTGCRQRGMARAGFAGVRSAWEPVSCTAGALKFFNIFQQGALHFYFAVGPTNNIACPGNRKGFFDPASVLLFLE